MWGIGHPRKWEKFRYSCPLQSYMLMQELMPSCQTFLPTLSTRLETMSTLYRKDLESYNQLAEASNEIIHQESQNLAHELREVELLRPKLQYEISALQAKVDEVEEGVGGFGKQVEELERRLAALEPISSNGGWWGTRWEWVMKWAPWRTALLEKKDL